MKVYLLGDDVSGSDVNSRWWRQRHVSASHSWNKHFADAGL